MPSYRQGLAAMTVFACVIFVLPTFFSTVGPSLPPCLCALIGMPFMVRHDTVVVPCCPLPLSLHHDPGFAPSSRYLTGGSAAL